MNACVREAELEAAMDGRLDPEASRRVLQHARSCMRCREAQSALERITALAQGLPAEVPDSVRARRVRGAILGTALMGSAPSTPMPWRAWALVAACLAVFLGGAGLWRRGPERRTSPTAAVRVPRRSDPRQVDLAGAGTLWSAPDATVLVRSMGANTLIELGQGAITMQVNRRRAGERFVVQLADAEVEVHGTRFTVVADGGHLVRVDVAEGVVAVRHTGDAERLLTAGAHLLLPETTETTVATVREPVVPTIATVITNPAARPSAVDPGVLFREGSEAFRRGDHGAAERALGRFLTTISRDDPRREDARYLRVLSLDALGRVEPLCREASAYGREFPRGVRRAEVVLAEVRALASAGRCDEATQAATEMPDDAPARLRDALPRALVCTPTP